MLALALSTFDFIADRIGRRVPSLDTIDAWLRFDQSPMGRAKARNDRDSMALDTEINTYLPPADYDLESLSTAIDCDAVIRHDGEAIADMMVTICEVGIAVSMVGMVAAVAIAALTL